VFKEAQYRSLSWASTTQSKTTPLYLPETNFNTIPHEHLGLVFPLNSYMHYLSPPYVLRALLIICSLTYTWRSVQVMTLLIIQSSPNSHDVIPLQTKRYPRHPVLKHLPLHLRLYIGTDVLERTSPIFGI
jgi:hypothetical protein